MENIPSNEGKKTLEGEQMQSFSIEIHMKRNVLKLYKKKLAKIATPHS